MHMNSAMPLLNEDRPDFERILDEALRTEDTRSALAESSTHLNSEQLRTLALNRTAAITACAATEYQQYLKVREQVRESSPTWHEEHGHGTSTSTSTSGGIAGAMGQVTSEPTDTRTGAGLVAIVAVLAPILAGIAAIIFLGIGYSLELVTPEPSIAPPLRTAGWFFAVLAAAGVVVGMIAMVVTALHNPAADAENVRVARSPEVAAAREAWHRALLERGVRPFIHQALTEAEAAARNAGEHPSRNGSAETPPSRHPRLGYSRPGFSSPNPDDPTASRRGPEYSSPEYTSPDFSSPDFDTGAEEGSDHPDAERAP